MNRRRIFLGVISLLIVSLLSGFGLVYSYEGENSLGESSAVEVDLINDSKVVNFDVEVLNIDGRIQHMVFHLTVPDEMLLIRNDNELPYLAWELSESEAFGFYPDDLSANNLVGEAVEDLEKTERNTGEYGDYVWDTDRFTFNETGSLWYLNMTRDGTRYGFMMALPSIDGDKYFELAEGILSSFGVGVYVDTPVVAVATSELNKTLWLAGFLAFAVVVVIVVGTIKVVKKKVVFDFFGRISRPIKRALKKALTLGATLVLLGILLSLGWKSLVWLGDAFTPDRWTLMVCEEKFNDVECDSNSDVIPGFKNKKECLLEGARNFSKQGYECGSNCRDEYGLWVCKEICNKGGCSE
jgi:hypothetical protein